jgi:hypothetical protein
MQRIAPPAAKRTLAAPGSTELVDLIKHQITTTWQPSVSVLVDGHGRRPDR